MCDKQDEALLFRNHKKTEQDLKKCKKCEENSIVVLRVNDAYCRSCFLAYFIHKFRACLGKAKVMKQGDKVLMAFSGGQSSLAMMHLIKQALEEENKKKLEYYPVILYIDEGAILNQTYEERNNICSEIFSSVPWARYPFYITTLEMTQDIDINKETNESGFITQITEKNKVPRNSILEKRLHDLFSSISTLSAKEEMLERLRYRLIGKIAEKLHCSKIFLGDSASLLSIRLLSNIAQGRGAHLKSDTGFSHHLGESKTLILRPMRELLSKEIAVYNNLNKISSVTIPTLATKAASKASIFHLMEEFINGLQQEFPATVSTVFRTGDKLDSHTCSTFSQSRCILCENYLDTDAAMDSALYSVESSRITDQVKYKSFENGQSPSVYENCNPKNCQVPSNVKVKAKLKSCCKNNSKCFDDELALESGIYNLRISKEDLTSFICYGCRLIIQDCNDVNTLPESILSEAKRQIRRNQMKDEIAEFLL